MQTVKEILECLVVSHEIPFWTGVQSDQLVQCEKIGISNYFWSFPSTATQARLTSLATLKEQLEQLHQQKGALEKQLEEANVGREPTVECILISYGRRNVKND